MRRSGGVGSGAEEVMPLALVTVAYRALTLGRTCPAALSGELARITAAPRPIASRDEVRGLRWRTEHLCWQLDVLRDQFEQVRRAALVR